MQPEFGCSPPLLLALALERIWVLQVFFTLTSSGLLTAHLLWAQASPGRGASVATGCMVLGLSLLASTPGLLTISLLGAPESCTAQVYPAI